MNERKSFGWTLAILTLVLYYGYIAIVAFSPATIAIEGLGQHHDRDHSRRRPDPRLDLLTGIYVLRANSRYDQLTQAIVQAATAGGRK